MTVLDQVAREGGSPVRAYLLRHLADAQVELGHATKALENAERDHATAAETVDTIIAALGYLDELEAPMEYGHPTTSPGSPAGPGPEEDPDT